MEFNINDLILVRLPNNPKSKKRQRHYNVWIRVLFVDDNESHGKIERCPSPMDGFYLHKRGGTIGFENSKVLDIYDENDGKQWCYSDGSTRCDCKGLCRNK